jgi:hypothetical protein
MGILDRSKSITENITENINAPIGIQGDDNQLYQAGGDVYAVSTDFNAVDRATELAARALEAGESLAGQSFDLSLATTREVADIAAESRSESLGFARDLQTKFQNVVSSTVDAIQRIGVEQNKSTDQRLAESTERTLKYAVIALGVMAVGLAAFAYVRK